MKTDEFVHLSRQAVQRLLEERQQSDPVPASAGPERRRHPRWPFPAPVELWVPGEDGIDEHVLGTCKDLSCGGVGISCDCELPVGVTLPIAIHQPEVTFHGYAIVRRCMRGPDGYHVGLEFPDEA